MDQIEFSEILIEYVSGKLSPDKQEDCDAFLLAHPEHLQEVEQLKMAWLKLDDQIIPEPSEQMDNRFYAMLREESQEKNTNKDTFLNRLRAFFFSDDIGLTMRQVAFACLLLVGGVFLGNKFQKSVADVSPTLASETDEVRSELVMALIDQPSASKRLQAVNEANKLDAATDIIIDALFKTLHNDPNINVRLATIESLSKYAAQPKVRQGLVESINQQESPLVQLALADLMVTLQEKGSIDSMKELLEQPDIDTTVKQQIRSSIEQIS